MTYWRFAALIKKILAVFIALNLLGCSVCFAADNWGDNTNGADDNIVDEITWLESDEYTILDNFVLGVSAGTELDDFKSSFKNAGSNLENIIIETDKIKTGDTVQFNGSDKSYSVVVDGDVDKDGDIDVTDLQLANEMICVSTTNSIEYKAANIDKSNGVNVVDIVIIRSLILQ